MESTDMLETAARAAINERCAAAFLHDVRGSMQALFSSFELLGRAAKMAGGNAERSEKAIALAKRAMAHHEKSTMEILQLLTWQRLEPVILDVVAAVRDAVHFLRNDAVNKNIVFTVVASTDDLSIRIEQRRFHMLLVGLLAGAIDHAALGTELTVNVSQPAEDVVITLGSDAGLSPSTQRQVDHATLAFARNFIESGGGRLEIDSANGPYGTLKLFHPAATHAHLPHPRCLQGKSNIPTNGDL
jgi:hypothetical protein